jgi:hypothetical protein
VIARGEVVAEKGRFALRIVCLVGEDGKDVPPPPGSAYADPVVAADDVSHAAPAAPAPASAPEPAAPPPPVDPLASILDDLT